MSLRQAVAHDARGFGKVLSDEDGPAIDCEIHNNLKRPGYKWAICTMPFEVRQGEDMTTRSCELLYSYHPSSGSVARGAEELFEICSGILSEPIE